jgi:hypothetical protein
VPSAAFWAIEVWLVPLVVMEWALLLRSDWSTDQWLNHGMVIALLTVLTLLSLPVLWAP